MIRLFIALFLVLLLSPVEANPGTMNTDDNPALKSEASLSGYRTVPLDLNEEKQEQVEDTQKENAGDTRDEKVQPPAEQQGESE